MTRVMIIDDLEYIKILGHMVNLCFAKRIENRIDLTLTYGPLDLDLTAIWPSFYNVLFIELDITQ